MARGVPIHPGPRFACHSLLHYPLSGMEALKGVVGAIVDHAAKMRLKPPVSDVLAAFVARMVCRGGPLPAWSGRCSGFCGVVIPPVPPPAVGWAGRFKPSSVWHPSRASSDD